MIFPQGKTESPPAPFTGGFLLVELVSTWTLERCLTMLVSEEEAQTLRTLPEHYDLL